MINPDEEFRPPDADQLRNFRDIVNTGISLGPRPGVETLLGPHDEPIIHFDELISGKEGQHDLCTQYVLELTGIVSVEHTAEPVVQPDTATLTFDDEVRARRAITGEDEETAMAEIIHGLLKSSQVKQAVYGLVDEIDARIEETRFDLTLASSTEVADVLRRARTAFGITE